MKLRTHIIFASAMYALVVIVCLVMTALPTQPADAKIKTAENSHTTAVWELSDGSPYAAHNVNCAKCAGKGVSK